MSVFASCMDARNMTTISEIDCPCFSEKDSIEDFTKDGLSVEDAMTVEEVILKKLNVEGKSPENT